MELNNKNIKKILLIITFAVVIFAVSQNIPAVIAAFLWLYKLLSPIILGLTMAFVLNIFMKIFEERVFKGLKTSKKKWTKKLVRPLSIIATLVLAFGILIIVSLVIIPEIAELFKTLRDSLPSYLASVGEWLQSTLDSFNIDISLLEELNVNWEKTVNSLFSSFMKGSGAVLGTATSVAGGVISFSTNLVLGFVIAIYVLAQKEQICSFTRSFFKASLPKKVVDESLRLAAITSDIFSKFIIGQLTEAVILGGLCFVGMLVFRFPYAMVISVFISFTALIPIIGAFLGGAVGAVLILMVSPLKALLFLIFLTVLQQLEGDFIYPKVVGKTVGLPSLLVLIAIVIGGNIGGIMGILLSVPVCAVIYTLTKEFIAKKS